MTRRFTRILAAFALLVGLMIPLGMRGETATIQYTGATTQNMTGYNDADLVGLTSTDWSVVGGMGGHTLYPGLNKSGYIALYYNANGSNTITVTNSADNTISSITITYTSPNYNKGKVYVNNSEVTGTNGTYSIGASSFVITNGNTSNVQVRISKIEITYSGDLTPTTTTITAPSNFNNDLYVGTSAGTLTAVVTETNGGAAVSGATVVWASTDTNVATVDQNGAVTLVAVGTTNITATYEGNTTYAPSTGTYQLNVVDNTPFDGVIFNATEDTGTSPIIKDNVSLACTNGVLNNGSEYRFYKSSTTTISATDNSIITKIEFIGVSGNPASGFGNQTGWTTSGDNGTWVGEASSVSFTASGAQVRATLVKVTVEPNTNPLITADDVEIAYNATSGLIEYTITNPVEGGAITSAVVTASNPENWLTVNGSNPYTSPISLSCAVNTTATQKTATVTLTYTYNRETVTETVNVTQAADPNATMTIAEVRAQGTGSVVTTGIVTSCVGTTGYIQDATAAICVYGEELTVGNEIKVSGSLTTYKGLLEIENPQVTVLSSGNTTNPEEMTIAAINVSTNQGWYVRIVNATITEIGSNNNYTIAQGENTITLHGNLGVDEVAVNSIISLNGNIGCYNTVQIVNPQNVEVQAVPSITVTPMTVNAPAEGVNDSFTVTCDNVGNPYELDVNYYTSDGTALQGSDPDWIEFSNLNTENATNIGYYIQANNGAARTAYLKIQCRVDGNTIVESELITINQDAYVAPPTPGTKYVKVTSINDLFDGQYLIVYEDGDLAFNGGLETLDATSNSIEVDIEDNEIAATIATTAAEFTIDMTAGTIKSASGYYIGRTANSNGMNSSNSEAYTNTISIDENNNAVITSSAGPTLRYNKNSDQRRFRYFGSGQQAIQLYKKVVTMEIAPNKWYLIASPVGDVAPTDVANMTTGSYALYRFDQEGDTDGKEWINYKNSTDGGFDLEFGKGYLYANQTGCTLTFTGTPVSFSDNDDLNVLPLEYEEGVGFSGYNLLGNPFNQKVYVDGWPYYVMNSDGDAIIEGHSGINPMQGFFVIADGEDEVVTLTLESTGEKGASVALNVSRNRGNVIDRVRVRFGESRQLPKFQLFEGSTKVYIPQGDQDYAVVHSEGQGELPVNFHASENGTYTLSMDVENMDMNYLHLIDNMTGMDVDLLQTPSYTFEAKVNDYESRFRLVFAANNEDGVSTGSTAFAFFSNGNWIINNAGEATLQVVDLTGRILSSETVNGSVSKTINAVPGVYMLRLINGDNVNVQKIVVR